MKSFIRNMTLLAELFSFPVLILAAWTFTAITPPAHKKDPVSPGETKVNIFKGNSDILNHH